MTMRRLGRTSACVGAGVNAAQVRKAPLISGPTGHGASAISTLTCSASRSTCQLGLNQEYNVALLSGRANWATPWAITKGSPNVAFSVVAAFDTDPAKWRKASSAAPSSTSVRASPGVVK